MIVKGKSRSNGVQLGAYLLSMEANEEVRVLEISGMATDDLTQALIEMQEITDRGQRGVKGLYHSIISPQPGYQLTEDQWLYGQALGDRLRASTTLARRVGTALGKKYRAIANRFSERWRELRKSIGGGKGKGGGHGAAIEAPVATPTKHTTAFNKAAKALKAVERQAREDQSRKAPTYDR